MSNTAYLETLLCLVICSGCVSNVSQPRSANSSGERIDLISSIGIKELPITDGRFYQLRPPLMAKLSTLDFGNCQRVKLDNESDLMFTHVAGVFDAGIYRPMILDAIDGNPDHGYANPVFYLDKDPIILGLKDVKTLENLTKLFPVRKSVVSRNRFHGGFFWRTLSNSLSIITINVETETVNGITGSVAGSVTPLKNMCVEIGTLEPMNQTTDLKNLNSRANQR